MQFLSLKKVNEKILLFYEVNKIVGIYLFVYSIK